MRPFFEKLLLHDATEAIARVVELGNGVVAVSCRLGTSNQTVWNLQKIGRVQNAVFAHLMEDIAQENAESDADRRITSRVLSGMDPWDRSDGAAGNSPRRRRRTSAIAAGEMQAYRGIGADLMQQAQAKSAQTTLKARQQKKGVKGLFSLS